MNCCRPLLYTADYITEYWLRQEVIRGACVRLLEWQRAGAMDRDSRPAAARLTQGRRLGGCAAPPLRG